MIVAAAGRFTMVVATAGRFAMVVATTGRFTMIVTIAGRFTARRLAAAVAVMAAGQHPVEQPAEALSTEAQAQNERS
jgi:hypothetical protein